MGERRAAYLVRLLTDGAVLYAGPRGTYRLAVNGRWLRGIIVSSEEAQPLLRAAQRYWQ